MTAATRTIGGTSQTYPEFATLPVNGITPREVTTTFDRVFPEHGVTTAASIIMVWMPNQIQSLNPAGPWSDDYYTVIPSLMGYMGGFTPAAPDGWTPDEVIHGPHPHPAGPSASFGIGNSAFLKRMIHDGFEISAFAYRHADGIGGSNLSNVVLSPNRTRTSLGTHASYYESHSFNSMEVHGITPLGYNCVAFNMKPSQFSGNIGSNWFSVTGNDGATVDMASGLTSLPDHTLWSEGSHGNPGSGHSVPFGLPNLHSDGEYKSDPTMVRMHESILFANNPTSKFGFGSFSARPKPGHWSFWFYCPRTERVSPVWYNRAGCTAGGFSAVEANMFDPDWYPDNWAMNGANAIGLISGHYMTPPGAWDVVGGDHVYGQNGDIVSPMFSGINATVSGRYSAAGVRPLCEYRYRDYYVLTQPYEVLMWGSGLAASQATYVGAEVTNSRAPPSQLIEGIGLSHPHSLENATNVIGEPQLSFTTFATDSVVGSDPTLGRLAYATQVDGVDDQFYVTNGSNQALRFDASGANGESYNQNLVSTLTRTSGCLDVDFLKQGTAIQRWISPLRRALGVKKVGESFVGTYIVGMEQGFTATDAQVNGATAGTIASTAFFLPPTDPMIYSYAQTFSVSNGVTNEYRLPVIRIDRT